MVFAKLDKINRKEKINSNDTYTFEIQSIQLCLQKNKMVGHKTFTIIKPDAFKASYAGPIIEIIENAGFKIKNMRLVEMDKIMASRFYAVHKERPFFTRLCDYMCSGPIIVIELEKENAVLDFRKLIGSTNPEEAEEGTIRKKYATSIEANAIHGSDSDENAQIEIDFFFR